jgi:hypothetical protein
MHHALILHCLISGHALLALVCLVQLANCDSSRDAVWQKVSSTQCLNESQAVKNQQSDSAIECTGSANALSGLLVAQLNADTRQCSVFHYQSVCHLIDAAASSAHHTQHSCTVYASHKTIKFINSTKNVTQNLNAKFQGVWVMSDDEDASKSNLVCGQTPLWQTSGVEWTKEGAKFDGTSSKMTLENVNFTSMSLGFTWLLRLKRTPVKEKVFLKIYSCDGEITGSHLNEVDPVRCLQFSTAQHFTNTQLLQAFNTLSSDAGEFMNFGITAAPVSNIYKMFYSDNFVTPGGQGTTSWGTRAEKYDCLSLGSTAGNKNVLDGTVKVVGIASDMMSDTEIREFFELVT